jgi:2-methylcitrate dehydratase PrpD
MTTDAAKKLASFTVNTTIKDITPGAIDFTKQLALKTVAGMLAGSHMPSGKKIANFIKKNPDGKGFGVIGFDFEASLWKSVFADAFFAHQSELEDDRLSTGTSWDITTFPMLFPLAQNYNLTGAQMVEASAIGLEVMARTCQFTPQGYLGLSIVPPSIGPAALAANVLELNQSETMAAFGLCMSGIATAYVNFGTDAHYFETSMQTVHGLIAAQAASLGLTSNPDIVKYLSNLLGAEKVIEKDITSKLGQYWQFREIWLKKYPCCLYTHRYIDGLLEIIRKEDIQFRDIKQISVHVAAGAMEVCNRPKPKTIGDLQFSYQHTLSSAAMDRDVNYKHIAQARLSDSKTIQAWNKVKVVIHPEWKARLPVETPAKVEIELSNGKKYMSERAYPTGTLKEPLSLLEVKALFHKFVGKVLPEKDKIFVADSLCSLEDLSKKDVKQLIAVLTRQKTKSKK